MVRTWPVLAPCPRPAMPPVTRSAARAAADSDDDAPPAKKQRGGGGAAAGRGGASGGGAVPVPRLRKAFHGGMRPVIGHRPPPGANPFAGPRGRWTTLEW